MATKLGRDGAPPTADAAAALQGPISGDGLADALATARSVQHSEAQLLACCTQAVEQCRADLAELRTAVKAATAHRGKCAELLGAATEAVVALEDLLYDPEIDLQHERELQRLASRTQTALDQGEAVVKVYGSMNSMQKFASRVFSSGTPLKLEESVRELTNLAKQARMMRQQQPSTGLSSALTGGREVPEEAMQERRLRKGTRGHIIKLMAYVPAIPGTDPAGHLGHLWYYVSKVFGGALLVCDLSSGVESEVREARRDAGVSCMHYDEDTGLIWTGHSNGKIRVWSAAKQEAVLDAFRAFNNSVTAITIDEQGRCWAGSNAGRVRCLLLESLEDGVSHLSQLGELRGVADGMQPPNYGQGQCEYVNGMAVHPLASEPAHFGPVRCLSAAAGRVWTCGGGRAFARFTEWTQAGVFLGSRQFTNQIAIGMANDMVLTTPIAKLFAVERAMRHVPSAPGEIPGSFTTASITSMSLAVEKREVEIEQQWQLLTAHTMGVIQVWGVIGNRLEPLVRIGERTTAPALKIVVCEPLGALITAHSDGELRVRAVPHPRGPMGLRFVYEGSVVKVRDEKAMPSMQLITNEKSLATVGGALGVLRAANGADIQFYPAAELRRLAEEKGVRLQGANMDPEQWSLFRFGSAAVLQRHLEEVQEYATASLGDFPTATATWSSDFVKSDQLLSWITTHVPPASTASSKEPSSKSSIRSSQIVDIQPWEVNFLDLQMERVIGRGSFGKVYLASLHETPVAVKILMKLEDSAGGKEEPATLSDPALAELYKETELLCTMRHPNVVQLMGFCTYPPAIITEFCSRGSLTDVLQAALTGPQMAAQLTWARRLHMALDAARGVLALHAHSPTIIHKDLKGPNLLVEASWRVKVTDFNLSKVLENDGSMQSTSSPVNPRWLAPEILKGARASIASDAFSYGVVLWELLTWQVPWAGVDFWEIVSKLMKGERLPVPPREQLPGPDTQQFGGLDTYCTLMQRCWAQAPEERPDLSEIIRCLRPLADAAAP